MQHSILDRIYIAFLAILIVSFGILIVFTSMMTRRSLIAEKTETLSNEASLIAQQTILGYLTGRYSEQDLVSLFDYYSSSLNADVWYVDEYGRVVATSQASQEENEEDGSERTKVQKKPELDIPYNIYQLAPDYNITTSHSEIGDFYGLYPQEMISVSMPVHVDILDGNRQITRTVSHGSIIILATASQINEQLRNIFSIVLIPCLVIIVIAFIFLAVVSRKVLTPVKRLSQVANEYSKGNLEVRTGITSQDEIGDLAESMEYMADELSKLEDYRRDFVSNISHDFRSPLTSIKGYVEAMKDGTIPPEKMDRYLDIVINETQRLTKLTQGLLDLNNLESYGPYLKLTEFDIIDVIKSTLNTFEIKGIERGVAIYLNNHAENTMVMADKTKIQQVIYNLIDNALKFTPEGKHIYVTVTEKEKEDKLQISVRDEGMGMDEEMQKKIFIRFYKGDPSRGKDKTGTGLGLAITKEIIKAHHEVITVESKVGEGTEFIFTLSRPHSEQIG
ncbi:MAG: HAMP domain-containing histidine kinase [Eubacterium sp.]|nr:HAMP domain-containing histidine kinase [Eubacterium sp.]MBR6172083.1 HAMP domain-containing histidine kinase [Eubacterium sp.]